MHSAAGKFSSENWQIFTTRAIPYYEFSRLHFLF